MTTTHFPEGPFTVAKGRTFGLTDWQMRSDALFVPAHGVRTTKPPEGLIDELRALATVLPKGAAFSHLTAARLHGIPMSYAMEEDERIHVTCSIAISHLRRAHVVGHRVLHPREVVNVEGVPTVGLADTWVDLGELVGRSKPVGLDDAIVAGDFCALALGDVSPMRVALAKRVRPRGKKLLLEAIASVRVGSWSPRETTTRLMFVRGGLPEPSLNRAIFASWNPTLLLGYGDLVWEFSHPDGRLIRMVGEYQGAAFHASDEQQAHDKVRRKAFGRDGWPVREIWNKDVASMEARHATVVRFAHELGVPESELTLSETDPRFFSRHAMELAVQRQDQKRARAR